MNFLFRQFRLMFVALTRFTLIAAPQWMTLSGDDASGSDQLSRQSIRYFPLVGLITGGLCALVYIAAIRWFPPAVCVLMTMAVSLVFTGATHESAFGEVCDVLVEHSTGPDPHSRSRQRATGTAAIVIVLLLKFALLSYLEDFWIVIALVAGHALSRLAALTPLLTIGGITADGVQRPGLRIGFGELLCAAVYGLLPLALVLGNDRLQPSMHGPLLLGAGLAFAGAALVCASQKRLEGRISEAGMGAAQQFAEVMFYIGMVASPR